MSSLIIAREERRVFSDYCERSVVSSLIIVRGASCLL